MAVHVCESLLLYVPYSGIIRNTFMTRERKNSRRKRGRSNLPIKDRRGNSFSNFTKNSEENQNLFGIFIKESKDQIGISILLSKEIFRRIHTWIKSWFLKYLL